MINKFADSLSTKLMAFNVWSIETAVPVMDAAADASRDVILQTSERVYKSINKPEFRQYIKSYSKRRGVNAWLHLDHCKDIKIIQDAIENKWDSVMIDMSEGDINENIRITRQVAEAAHAGGLLAESEIGRIGAIGELKKYGDFADINNVTDMIKTGTDMLAPAIGTAHGMYKAVPKIRYDLLGELDSISSIPLVIHGGSGLEDAEIRRLLSYGMVKKINFSTEVKLAYRKGIFDAMAYGCLDPDKFEVTKTGELIYMSIYEMASRKLALLE